MDEPALALMDTQRTMMPMSTSIVEDTMFVLTPDYDALVAELGDPESVLTALDKNIKASDKMLRTAVGEYTKEFVTDVVFPAWFDLAEIFDAEPEPEWPTVQQIWNELWPPAVVMTEHPTFDLGYLSLPPAIQAGVKHAAVILAEARRAENETTQTNLVPLSAVEPLAIEAVPQDTDTPPTEEVEPVKETEDMTAIVVIEAAQEAKE